MIRGFSYKFNRSYKNFKNVIFHIKLLLLLLRSRDLNNSPLPVFRAVPGFTARKEQPHWTLQMPTPLEM